MGLAAVGLGLSGLGALGGLFGLGSKNSGSTTQDSTSTPNLDPQTLAFRNLIMQMFTNQLNGANNGQFQQGYTNTGLNNIRNSSDIANDALQQAFASRGLSLTPAAANAYGASTLGRGAQVASFLNNVPLVMDQRNQQWANAAGNFFRSIPYGTTSHFSGTSKGNYTGGGGIGGATQGFTSSLGGYLGMLAGQGKIGGGNNNPQNTDWSEVA